MYMYIINKHDQVMKQLLLLLNVLMKNVINLIRKLT